MRKISTFSGFSSSLPKLPGMLLVVLFFLSSCSKEKDTFANRTFHATTTHYNYYFNAYESYRLGMKKLEDLHVDDFNEVLQVFPVGDEDDAQTVFPDMDKSIQKLSMAILKHSMYIAGRERNVWIDDAYLLIGKSQLAKRDYIASRSSFEFIISRFDKLPAKFEAMVYKARVHVLREEYEEAEPLLGIVGGALEKGRVNRETRTLYPQVYADMHLQQQNYAAAIPYLVEAIKVAPKKKTKYRLRYILAQVYYAEGRFEEAGKLFNKVIRMNPPYAYAFNARINVARCYDAEGGGSARGIEKLLRKMLKDEKNKEFLDQIYFALAELSLKQEDTLNAVELLRQSVATSVQNPNQKALSSLQLADLYFHEPDYKNAQAYYDSTMQFLDEDYPDYPDINSKTTTLTELVGHLLVIEREDSLQYVASLPMNERMAIIDSIIQTIIREEALERQRELERQKSVQFYEMENRKPTSVTQQGQSFYFYSSQAMSTGYTEFQKRWGGRKLEDLWRLSDKQSASFGSELTEGQDSVRLDSLAKASKDKKDPNFYLAQLPLTAAKIAASNRMIANALFGAGHVYRTGLNDPDKAISTFETLETRFPGDSLEVQTWFQLYNIYLDLDFKELAERYKQRIINQYPDTDYARLLQDPEYYSKLQAKKNEGELFYQTTFDAFKKHEDDLVIRNRAIAFAKYEDNGLLARFDYLRLLVQTRGLEDDSLRNVLVSFTNMYPETSASQHATSMISLIDERNMAADGGMDTTGTGPIVSGIYVLDAGKPHLLVIVVDGNKVNVNELKVVLSDHNLNMFSLKKLSITSILLDNSRQMITVSSFEDLDGVMAYFDTLGNNSKLMRSVNAGEGEIFGISTDNYAKFYKRKNTKEYMVFFESYYMK